VLAFLAKSVYGVINKSNILRHLSNSQDMRGALMFCHQTDRIEKICRETLDGLIALSLEVVAYRAYSRHRREPDTTSPTEDLMPCLQWIDMKRTFVRYKTILALAVGK